MDIGFQFEVMYKDKDLVEIRVSGWNGAFGGKTDLYVGIGQVDDVVAKLKGFPGHPADSREVILGAFGPDTAGGGLRMRFYCADQSGHAYVEAKIESEDKLTRPSQSVNMLLPIEAAALDSFLDELCRLAANEIAAARLEGSTAAHIP